MTLDNWPGCAISKSSYHLIWFFLSSATLNTTSFYMSEPLNRSIFLFSVFTDLFVDILQPRIIAIDTKDPSIVLPTSQHNLERKWAASAVKREHIWTINIFSSVISCCRKVTCHNCLCLSFNLLVFIDWRPKLFYLVSINSLNSYHHEFDRCLHFL